MGRMQDPQSKPHSPFGIVNPFVLIACVLLASIVIVNPIREMLSQDDSWIYARMVRHLLTTGHYQVDTAAAPNPLVQVYIAAGFAKIFGYSLVLLRMTTLGLFVVALLCWYLLLRELGHSREIATVFTLALLASPLVLILSFTFMSDVQFIAWVLLAELLYVRGIHRQSAVLLLLGSLAAGCAIGTRQFGVALIPGLAAAWIVPRRSIRPKVRLLLVALVVPCVAGVAQVYAGMRAPTIVQTWALQQTHAYLSSTPLVLAREMFWRVSLIAQYLAISLLPLLPLSFWIARRLWREHLGRVPLWLLSVLGCVAIGFALWMSSRLTARPPAFHRRGLWEPLELEWLLASQFANARMLMRLIDLAGIVGAAPLICMFLYAVRWVRLSRTVRPESVFLIASGLAMVALPFAFGRLNDTYVTGMVPYLLLLIAAVSRRVPPTGLQLRAALVGCAAFVFGLSLWMRAQYEYPEAFWKAGDRLQAEGVAPGEIATTQSWQFYNGMLDDWVAAGHPGTIEDWYQAQRRRAEYLLGLAYEPESVDGSPLLTSYEYRNVYFAKRYVVVIKRATP